MRPAFFTARLFAADLTLRFFVADLALPPYDAGVLVAERESAEFYEMVLSKLSDRKRDGKMAANWVINELFGRLNKEGLGIAGSPVSAEQLGAIPEMQHQHPDPLGGGAAADR